MGRVTVQDGRLFAYASEFPMDIMTSVGLVSGIIVVTVMVLMGGDLHMFISEHAIIIIFGGSISATLIRFPLSAILHGLPLGGKYAFTMSRKTARELVDELAHLDEGAKIYRAIGDCAPAFGMVGTLVGMVQMFANMTDPSKLGPFMATALLATLYGALVANLFCLPIADKLHGKLLDEETNRTLIIDGILMIRDSKSPTLVREMLLAYLPENQRWPRRNAATRMAEGTAGS